VLFSFSATSSSAVAKRPHDALCRNIALSFGMKKLEWHGYPTLKKFRRYVYSFWHDPRTWQTHRRTNTAWRHRPHLHSIAWQKCCFLNFYFTLETAREVLISVLCNFVSRSTMGKWFSNWNFQNWLAIVLISFLYILSQI